MELEATLMVMSYLKAITITLIGNLLLQLLILYRSTEE